MRVTIWFLWGMTGVCLILLESAIEGKITRETIAKAFGISADQLDI
ncbi:MAG TPA: hypothetical protein VGC62_20745 [Pseudomonas sp.]